VELKETWFEDVDWIHLALDMVQWYVLVNMVINFWFYKEQGIS
jgi:hypothetical protein